MSQQVNFNRLPSSTSFLFRLVSNTYWYAGIGLSLVTPLMLWAAHLSLQSTYRFSEARYWLFHPVGKILVVAGATLCFYHSLLSFYSSIMITYGISSRRVTSSIVILVLTTYFAAALGYWFW